MNDIEKKINDRVYSSSGRATSAVKRANLDKATRKRLLELVEKRYAAPSASTSPDPEPCNWLIPPEKLSELDGQLLRIAFQLVGLCLIHKLSREEIYRRLEQRLMAGVG